MNISAPFIRRPVATTLLTVAIALAGAIGFEVLPVAPLPEVDFPTISVSAGLPGASAAIMASSVATPLERQFGHMAGVTEMTSSSTLGNTSITIQFDLSRNIDGAARDVEAAINAARTYLPANLPGNPTYRKVNPADSPIMILGLTSDKYGPDKLYDEASTVMQQKLSQIDGVGQVSTGGGALPSVRVDANPTQLASYGLTLANLQSALSLQNEDLAKGQISDGIVTADILANDQISHANDFKPLVVGFKDGAAIHLSDVAQVTDSVQNVRAAGYLNGKRAITMIIFRQPGANIIDTVDRIRAELPSVQASIPAGIDTTIVLDRTTTIRASVSDVERTLLISVVLVVVVVFLFLRNARATLIPSVAVPVSLIGTFAVMYLLGYSLDNLSLMALTISTGFVVDDAIVMIENISRFIEQGMPPMKAALTGAGQIGFTIVSLTVSLIAVLIPLLFMGDVVGRLFREFAVTLGVTILVSAIVSLTLTPMMASRILKHNPEEKQGRLFRASEHAFNSMIAFYGRTLKVVLRYQTITLFVALGTLLLTILLYIYIPKGFFPVQDTGIIQGISQAPPSIGSKAMAQKQMEIAKVVLEDPAVESLSSFIGADGTNITTNSGRMSINLKPLADRNLNASDVIRRLQSKLADVQGVQLFMQPVQNITVDDRVSRTQYQYTLEDPDPNELNDWTNQFVTKLKNLK